MREEEEERLVGGREGKWRIDKILYFVFSYMAIVGPIAITMVLSSLVSLYLKHPNSGMGAMVIYHDDEDEGASPMIFGSALSSLCLILALH
jgi:hypothetical protein